MMHRHRRTPIIARRSILSLAVIGAALGVAAFAGAGEAIIIDHTCTELGPIGCLTATPPTAARSSAE